MRIAIFADIHGKILLPFKLVDLYQKQTGQKIDLILQCGDMGAFPNVEMMDKATIRHAKHDRDELGFSEDFVNVKSGIQNFLAELNINMICVRGNHEDHDYLDELEQKHVQNSRFPIDIYQRVWLCKSGLAQAFVLDNGEKLTFAGIGRIGDRKSRSEKAFIQEYEKKVIKKLQNSKQKLDILISHDKGASSRRGYGMPEISELLAHIKFPYHFHGHTGEPFHQAIHENGVTNTVKIKELEFDETGILPEGCMGMIEKNMANEFTFSVVEKHFTNQLTKFNWQF